MKAFFKDVKNFVTDFKFILPLIVVTFLGYGFIFFNFAIGIDDLTRPRYVTYENISQGRFSGTLIDIIFGFTEYKPIYEDLLSVIFMMLAGILAAVLLKRITCGGLHNAVYTFFACFFTTFPLINEIFLYGGAGLNASVGYALTFISLIIFDRFFESKNYLLMIPCLFIWIFNISLYESFIFVYSCMVCGMFLIRHMIAEGYLPCNSEELKKVFAERLKAKRLFAEIGYYVAVLAVAVIAEFIISKAVIKITGFVPSVGEAANSVTAFNLKNTVFYFFTHFVCASFRYLPIMIFMLCSLIGIIFAIRYTVKSKHGFYILYICGMFFSVFALSLLRSGIVFYRNIQCMVIFCGIIFALILQKTLCSKFKSRRITAAVLATVLVICQTLDLAKWFYVDYLRSEDEKSMMITVGNDLANNYDTSKTVIFYGEYTLPDEVQDYRYIRKDSALYNVIQRAVGVRSLSYFEPEYGIPIAQTDNDSVISWGVYAFNEVNTELLRYFKYLGYDFIQGTREQQEKGELIAENMFPRKSSYEIAETDEFIVVKFG